MARHGRLRCAGCATGDGARGLHQDERRRRTIVAAHARHRSEMTGGPGGGMRPRPIDANRPAWRAARQPQPGRLRRQMVGDLMLRRRSGSGSGRPVRPSRRVSRARHGLQRVTAGHAGSRWVSAGQHRPAQVGAGQAVTQRTRTPLGADGIGPSAAAAGRGRRAASTPQLPVTPARQTRHLRSSRPVPTRQAGGSCPSASAAPLTEIRPERGPWPPSTADEPRCHLFSARPPPGPDLRPGEMGQRGRERQITIGTAAVV